MIVYTLENCPKCKILKEKLIDAGIKFEEIDADIDFLRSKHIMSCPVLQLDNGECLDFGKAVKFISEGGNL